MGIQINGSTDTISAVDGSLSLEGGELRTVSGLNVTGVVTATSYQGDGSALTGIDATQIVTGDTSVQTVDTGSDGTIKFNTDGSERARIDSSGNFGLGTTTVARGPLHLHTSGDTQLHMTNSTTGATDGDGFTIAVSGSEALLVQREVAPLSFYTAQTERARIDSSGNFGLGTASPTARLDVRRGDTDGLIAELHQSSGYGIDVGSSESVAYISSGYLQSLAFKTDPNSGQVERARINSSGQLLINSTTSRTNVNTLEPRVQIEGNNNDTSTVALIANSTADGTGAQLHFCKSSTGTVGSNGAVVANEVLGRIAFDGNDGTNFETGAEILSTMQSNASTGNVSAKLRFYTRGDGSSLREAAAINAGGFTKLKGNYDGFISENGDSHEVLSNRSNDDCLINKTFNGSYTATNYMALAARSSTSAYAFFYGVSGHTGSTDTEFRLMGDGNAYADGSWNGGGADYAEMFEWSDGNADAEDRRGLSVVLDGDKIREAVSGEDPIGVISGNPSVIGDAGWNKWNQKHLTDDYGSYIFEDHNVVEWTDELGNFHSYEDWKLPEGIIVPDDAVTKTHDGKGNKLQHRAVNPAYDPDVTYVSRAERKEWDAVGLMGKLRIRKGQVTGARWIKMRDISDNVEEWLVR